MLISIDFTLNRCQFERLNPVQLCRLRHGIEVKEQFEIAAFHRQVADHLSQY